jgi:hypothetical protein
MRPTRLRAPLTVLALLLPTAASASTIQTVTYAGAWGAW